MTDPTITCPHCKTEIKLNESLAAPLIAATKQQFETQLAQKDNAIAAREQEIRLREKTLSEEKRGLDENIADQVSEKLKTERTRVAAEEAKKAKAAAAAELDTKARELADLQAIMHAQTAKLAEAQKVQADLLKKQRELDDAKHELELTVEKRVQGGLDEVRSQAKRDAEDGMKLKVAEKDQTIAAMQKNIETLKQQAEQGSQQLQGEVQELELEQMLRLRFPFDLIEPVPKGEFGGDALQKVNSQSGVPCGSILWESKRTKAWSDSWLAKLRDDQRTANADVCVIVTQTLPKGVETFDLIDNVWVTTPRAAIPVATMLRQGLLQISQTRALSQGQHTKAEMIYEYLTGTRFRQRIEAIVEAFTLMQEDLDKERKVIMKQWAKRGEQIERVMNSTVGMYGDLQGIAGKSLQEIEGLEFSMRDDKQAVKIIGVEK
jgi:hypothetical protein